MSISSKGKKGLEGTSSLKIVGASAAEAKSGGVAVKTLAEDTGSGIELRSEATRLARELEAPPTAEDAARREALMGRLVSLTARNV